MDKNLTVEMDERKASRFSGFFVRDYHAFSDCAESPEVFLQTFFGDGLVSKTPDEDLVHTGIGSCY